MVAYGIGQTEIAANSTSTILRWMTIPRLTRLLGFSLSVCLLAGTTGCPVHYSFSQGSLPPNIHTMAVLPFDNQTASPAVAGELFDAMHGDLEKRLGVRDAGQGHADAVVRGSI